MDCQIGSIPQNYLVNCFMPLNRWNRWKLQNGPACKGGYPATLTPEWKRVGSPWSTCVRALNTLTSSEFSKPWTITSTCAVSKSFWPIVDRKRSFQMLSLSMHTRGAVRDQARRWLPKLLEARRSGLSQTLPSTMFSVNQTEVETHWKACLLQPSEVTVIFISRLKTFIISLQALC